MLIYNKDSTAKYKNEIIITIISKHTHKLKRGTSFCAYSRNLVRVMEEVEYQWQMRKKYIQKSYSKCINNLLMLYVLGLNFLGYRKMPQL